jgi:hypothetical protein
LCALFTLCKTHPNPLVNMQISILMNTESQLPLVSALRTRSPYRKRWTIPYLKTQYNHLRPHNEAIEAAFMELIKSVKSLYSTRNELVFECSDKRNRALNSTTMHTFIASSLYLELECDFFELKCKVLYDFERCPFEREIRKLLTVYPLDTVTRHEPRKKGVSASFEAVKAFRGMTHFYNLSDRII